MEDEFLVLYEKLKSQLEKSQQESVQLKRKIKAANKQKIEADEMTNKAVERLNEVEEKHKQSLKLKQDTFQELIKELFEKPSNKIVENVISQSSKSIKITLLVAILSIIISSAISLSILIYSIDSSEKDQIEISNSFRKINSDLNNASTDIDLMKEDFYEVSNSITLMTNELDTILDKTIIKLDTTLTKSFNKIETTISKIESSIIKSEANFRKLSKETRKSKDQIDKIVSSDELIEEIRKYIIGKRNKFGEYNSQNDLSLLYKMRLVREYENAKIEDFYDAFSKTGIPNRPSILKIQDWSQEMIDLCNKAQDSLKTFSNTDTIPTLSRLYYFDTFKSKKDETNYGSWKWTNNATYEQIQKYFRMRGEMHSKVIKGK